MFFAILGTALLAGPPAPSEIALDIFVFSQEDRGGNPNQSEGIVYSAARFDARIVATDTVSLRGNLTVGRIQADEPIQPLPLGGITVTSASADTFTLDALAGVDIRRRGSPWAVRPAVFYHHQFGYFSPGVDLAVSRELAGGDTVLTASWVLRAARRRRLFWDGADFGIDRQVSNTFLFSWAQNLTPRWNLNVGFQYARQDGLLSETFNFVTLEDVGGRPIALWDEILPRERNRFQTSIRTRYSPRRGLSLGLDTSYYADDWGIQHGAAEPSVVLPLGDETRWRLWYRVAKQNGSRFVTDGVVGSIGRFRTQDSDLTSFTLHSPGTELRWILNPREETRWVLRLSLFGFYRTDKMFSVGGSAGVAAQW